MLINKLKISNFGSYEGETEFNFQICNPQKNIILIGGKNGAGKTTLFTAIKLGLYGPLALGFETTGLGYYRNIRNYINNKSLSKKNVNTSICIDFTLEEEREIANYLITRQWLFEDKKLAENYSVKRNGVDLLEDDLNSFESYLQFIIPPQLFDLFFFDGEKISEFFLANNSTKNIRDALLILSGFDTFEIIKNNFKKVFRKGDTELLSEEEERFANLTKTHDEYLSQIEELKQKQIDIEYDIVNLEETKAEVEKQFRNSGGLLAEEVDNIKIEISKEEKYREERNEWLRDFANDFLPFLISRQLVAEVKEQVLKESSYQKYSAVKEALSDRFLKQVINDEIVNKNFKITDANNNDHTFQFIDALASHIDKKLQPDFDTNDFRPIHFLSHDDENEILALIKEIEGQNADVIKKCKAQIGKSLLKSQELRKKLEDSQNNDHLTSFIDKLNDINGQVQQLLIAKEKTVDRITELEGTHVALNAEIKRAGEALSKTRKDSSILALCSESYNLLNSFIPSLVDKELDGVKNRFIQMFNKLISKQNYVEGIDIDSEFNITLYRDSFITTSSLENMISKIGVNGLSSHLGDRCISKLMELLNVSNEDSLEKALSVFKEQLIPLPTKVDINSFSKGEQQIYIMSLYWALVKVSKYEIPFIIDTPYARIDSMHRENITTKFFPNLSSQVIILSTDEEVTAQYYRALCPFIAKEYTISYSDREQKTNVEEKYFFEVAS